MLRSVARDIILTATATNASGLGSLADGYLEVGPDGAQIPARHHEAFDRQAVGYLVDAELTRAGIKAAGRLVAAFRTLARRREDMAEVKRRMAEIVLQRSERYSEAVALAEIPAAGSA